MCPDLTPRLRRVVFRHPVASASIIPIRLHAGVWTHFPATFPREKVHALYGDKATFLAKFEAAAKQSVAAGVLLPRDVPLLLAEAAATYPN